MSEQVGRSPLAWLGGLLGIYLLAPIGYFLYRFAVSGQRGFGQPGLGAAFAASAETATISTALIALFGVPLAYWLGRSTGVIAGVVGVLVQLPLALPPVMSGIVLIYVVGPYTPIGNFFDDRLTDSLAGVVLAQTFVAAPFLIIAARSAFTAIDQALLDVAATAGHRPLRRFWFVSLPMAATGIRAGLLLTWLRALGEYGATVLLAYHPYTLPVFTSVQFASSGLPTTQAPTALALALAASGLILNLLRRPRVLRRRTRLAPPVAPGPLPATVVAFDIDMVVGSFRLRLQHAATSNRLAILGPSGSGKTLTLRALAGLLEPQGAVVTFNASDVSRLPAAARSVGYVPQAHGLLPHRTVWGNVLFGVHADPGRGSWWLGALKLDGLEGRLPSELSGGQRQRASIAQAMARQPRLVLLDEPFSALDAPVRHELRQIVRRLQRQAGLSTVLVTHDPEEAALLADDVMVIADGRLLQAGPRREVYDHPASEQVARLLGISNIVGGIVQEAGVVRSGRALVSADTTGFADGEPVSWCVREHDVHLDVAGDHPAAVEDVADIGVGQVVTATVVDGPRLTLRTSDQLSLQPGDHCRLRIDCASIAVCRPDDAGA